MPVAVKTPLEAAAKVEPRADNVVVAGKGKERAIEGTGTVEAREQSPSRLDRRLHPPLEPPAVNLFKALPTEIVVRILSHLTPHELAQCAGCCREVC